MPAPVQPIYPALYLYPLNDTFIRKQIFLPQGQHIKIGRQTNAKTAPGERNGFFDSKVLSRAHAEVWEESSKIWIKDVKSSNGTFINGERLSPEGVESDPFELKNDDIVEFGIDIVGEDNKTIIHHKVAARVFCVFSEQDAQVAARAEQHQQQQSQQYQGGSGPGGSSSLMAQPGPSSATVNGAGAFNFAAGQQRRPQVAQRGGLMDMGGMGGGMRPPGKSGLTFDHILSRLQGELQKSRETGAELHTLSASMNEIHDTLGGNLPANLPSYPSTLPPVRVASSSQSQPPSQAHSQQASAQGSSSGSPEQPSAAAPAGLTASALVDLQAQLEETRSSLTSHVDKIRALEGALAEQEVIKQEVRALREMMKQRELELHERNARRAELRDGFDDEEEENTAGEPSEDDMDDTRSIATIVPHELERVEEEDEEQLAADAQDQVLETQSESSDATLEDSEKQLEPRQSEDAEPIEEVEDEEARRRRNDELGRPRTPEPTNLGMRDGDRDAFLHRASALLASKSLASPHRASSPLSQVVATGDSSAATLMTEEVFEQVLDRVNALMTLTTTLEAQHTAAQTTISALESKVHSLEETLKATQAAQVHSETQTSPPASPKQSLSVPVEEKEPERESLTAMVTEWKKSIEGQWSSVREDWAQERERLSRAREQWELQVQNMDSGLEKLASLQTAAAVAFQQQQQRQRDLEQELERQRQHHHRAELLNGDAVKHIGLATPPSPRSISSDSNRPRRRRSSGARRGRSRQRSRSPSGEADAEFDTDTDITLASEDPSPSKSKIVEFSAPRSFSPSSSKHIEEEEDDAVLGIRARAGAAALATPESSVYKLPSSSTRPIENVREGDATGHKHVASHTGDRVIHMQTAVGVLVLAVAAAAVIWRVKPET